MKAFLPSVPSVKSPRSSPRSAASSSNATFLHTKAVTAAARATSAAATAMMARVSSLGDLKADSPRSSQPKPAASSTPRDVSKAKQAAKHRGHSGGIAVPAPEAERGEDEQQSQEKKASTAPTSPTKAGAGGEIEVFPTWIRDRKDFQVFFPRFAERVVTDEEILRQGVPKDPADRNIVELQCLARWIMKIPSMSTFLDLSQATEIAKLARYQVFKPGTFVFRKGDKGDACYLVFWGEAHVLIDGQKVASVLKNSAFGDIALQLENATRGADVQASPATNNGLEVLKILADDYHKTLARCQTRRRKHLINWLHTEVTLFRDCVESKLHFFELVSIDVPLKKGEILYHQNDSVGAFYVVRSGKVRLEVDIQYEHKHRWPCGKHQWREQIHASKARVPFHYEETAGFFGFEMFVENQQQRAFTAIAESATVELVALNRIDCFSPYFSFTPRAIEKIMEKHDKYRELSLRQIHQKLKEFRRQESAQRRSLKPVERVPVFVEQKYAMSTETPEFQFPRLQRAKWDAVNDTVKALQLACE